jgi:hypothetical protein
LLMGVCRRRKRIALQQPPTWSMLAAIPLPRSLALLAGRLIMKTELVHTLTDAFEAHARQVDNGEWKLILPSQCPGSLRWSGGVYCAIG